MRRINPRLVGRLKDYVSFWVPAESSDSFGKTSFALASLQKVLVDIPAKSAVPSSLGDDPTGSGATLYYVYGISDGDIDRLTEGDMLVSGWTSASEPIPGAWKVQRITTYTDRFGEKHHLEVSLAR